MRWLDGGLPLETKVHHAAAYGVTITEQWYDEFRNDWPVHFLVDPAICGVRLFRTGTGYAALDQSERYLLIGDRRLVLVADLSTGRCCHFAADHYLVSQCQVRDGHLHLRLDAPYPKKGRERLRLRLDPLERPLRPGPGPAVNGLFPSAWQPGMIQGRPPASPGK